MLTHPTHSISLGTDVTRQLGIKQWGSCQLPVAAIDNSKFLILPLSSSPGGQNSCTLTQESRTTEGIHASAHARRCALLVASVYRQTETLGNTLLWQHFYERAHTHARKSDPQRKLGRKTSPGAEFRISSRALHDCGILTV